VITFAEKRDAETVDDVLAKAVMDYQQAMKVLQVSDSVLDKIISEKKITALNVTPKAEYKTMQVVTASVKAYLSQRTVLLGKFTSSLEEAGNLLGVSRERVRQLIHEGKIDAIDVSTNGDTHSRWMVSRDSIQGRVEGLRLPGAG
jgi:excisionase family DNA binding protein